MAREGLSRWPPRDGGADGARGERGRPAGCGGGSAAAPGPLSRPLRASSHTSPPPAPSVRSREYPPPPSPHLLLPRRPLAPRGRPLSPGGSPGPGPTTGRGWMGRPEPGVRREGSGPKAGIPMPRGEAHGAMRTTPHLARSVRRSGGGGAGVRRLRVPRQGTCFNRPREPGVPRQRRGLGLSAAGRSASRSWGGRGELGGRAGPAPRDTTKWTDGISLAPPG